MRVRTILLAAALVLAPLGARAADLVVWWEDEFAPGENDAVREMIAAFEKKTDHRILAHLGSADFASRIQSSLVGTYTQS